MIVAVVAVLLMEEMMIIVLLLVVVVGDGRGVCFFWSAMGVLGSLRVALRKYRIPRGGTGGGGGPADHMPHCRCWDPDNMALQPADNLAP